MIKNIITIYKDLDTRSKRCIIIDLYSILFIITPTKYIIKKNIIISLFILLFQIIFIKGNDKIDNLNKDYQNIQLPSKKRINMI